MGIPSFQAVKDMGVHEIMRTYYGRQYPRVEEPAAGSPWEEVFAFMNDVPAKVIYEQDTLEAAQADAWRVYLRWRAENYPEA